MYEIHSLLISDVNYVSQNLKLQHAEEVHIGDHL